MLKRRANDSAIQRNNLGVEIISVSKLSMVQVCVQALIAQKLFMRTSSFSSMSLLYNPALFQN
jgi:hypothetical protein